MGSSSHKLTALVDANPFILGTTHRLFNAQPGNTDSSFSYLDQFGNLGAGTYNSLQLSLQKRFSDNRFFGQSYFTLAYTYGHGIDTASGFRQSTTRVPYYSHKQFRASTDFDIRHRLVFSGGWDLPFHHAWSSGPSRLTKGWSVYPILTYRAGLPIDIYAGLSRSRTRPGPSAAGDPNMVRANLVGSSVTIYEPKAPQTFDNRTGNYYFSPANFSNAGLSATCTPCVTNPAIRTYGTLGRNAFHGPSRFNMDFAVAKTTPLVGERLRAEFRAEFFNIFNNAQFYLPNTNISSTAFGQITNTYDPRILQFALRFTF